MIFEFRGGRAGGRWQVLGMTGGSRDRASAREAVASLFDGGIDPMVVIRWKDLFERLEAGVDATERAANIIEGIAVKSS